MSKRKIESYIIAAAVAAFISGFGAGTADIPEPEETLIETTAHEFMHYIQKIKGKPYSEEEAEHFAETVRYQVKRRIADTRAQTQPKKRHFKNPAQYIGSRKKRKKIVRGK